MILNRMIEQCHVVILTLRRIQFSILEMRDNNIDRNR